MTLKQYKWLNPSVCSCRSQSGYFCCYSQRLSFPGSLHTLRPTLYKRLRDTVNARSHVHVASAIVTLLHRLSQVRPQIFESASIYAYHCCTLVCLVTQFLYSYSRCFPVYGVSMLFLHRESTDSLIHGMTLVAWIDVSKAITSTQRG